MKRILTIPFLHTYLFWTQFMMEFGMCRWFENVIIQIILTSASFFVSTKMHALYIFAQNHHFFSTQAFNPIHVKVFLCLYASFQPNKQGWQLRGRVRVHYSWWWHTSLVCACMSKKYAYAVILGVELCSSKSRMVQVWVQRVLIYLVSCMQNGILHNNVHRNPPKRLLLVD